MALRRVVITGMGAVSPFGKGVDILMESMIKGQSGVTGLPELAEVGGLRSRVAALVNGIDPKVIPRKYRRSMSKMSIYATLACQDALQQACVSEKYITGGQLGVSIGSTLGSTNITQSFFEDFFTDHSLERMKSTVFFKIMGHSCAANVSQALGITGRILAPSSACSTGSQAVGYGFETIAFGKQDFMLCGGADEYHPLTTATFDIINAASINYNDDPNRTPRPFDRDRDGLVCSEGCGILLLESMKSAQKRDATILAEIIGFATTSDPSSIANPNAAAIETCMMKALKDANVRREEIDYINAHATATIQGDIAESQAIFKLFGSHVPVSSLKGHLGHTMAASGALELVATISMMNRGCIIPTLNLDNVDQSCEKIGHVQGIEKSHIKTVIKNNFALGCVNSSIVLRRYEYD